MEIDPKAAEQAFEQWLSKIEGVPQAGLASSNTDRQKAAVAALGVTRFCNQPENRARFDALPASDFNHAVLDSLEGESLACWHCTVKLKSASATTQTVKLPLELLQTAMELKKPMLLCTGYFLQNDAVAMKEVNDIRKGTGHLDLATDLSRLAILYRAHNDLLKVDPVHYQPTQADNADRLSQEILAELARAQGEEVARWNKRTRQAFTLVVEDYDEVAEAGRWIFRKDGGDKLFPSLYTAGRK